MRKKIIFIVAITLIVPLIAKAVTWQMDSNPFMFPVVSVKKNISLKANNTIFSASYNMAKGVVNLKYNIPFYTKDAALEIYTLSGIKIKSFVLSSWLKEIQWDVRSQKISSGVYFAILKYSNLQNKIQISIIK